MLHTMRVHIFTRNDSNHPFPCRELLDWAAEREVEMGGAEPVRGVPEGAEEQLQQIEVSL